MNTTPTPFGLSLSKPGRLPTQTFDKFRASDGGRAPSIRPKSFHY